MKLITSLILTANALTLHAGGYSVGPEKEKLILHPISCDGEGYIVADGYHVGTDWEAKKELIFKAENHRKKAVAKAKYMKEVFSYLPDLANDAHFEELIAGIITSRFIKSPREQILTVGMILLGSLGKESYSKYKFGRRTLCEITHHFEMHNFYSDISLTISDDNLEPLNYYEGYFYDAVDYLTLADILCICIEDDSDYYDCTDLICNHRTEVVNAFEDKKLKYKVSNKTNILINKVYDRIGLYYNSDHKSILYNLECSFNALYKAEKGWGI